MESSSPDPDDLPYSVCRDAEESNIFFFLDTYIQLLDGIIPLSSFAVSRTARSPKFITVGVQDRIVRSQNSLSALTLCICDCQILTTAYCFGLRQCVISCVHRCKDASQPSK